MRNERRGKLGESRRACGKGSNSCSNDDEICIDSVAVVEQHVEASILGLDPSDEMAQRLLDAKREGLHGDYTRAEFERLLGERFDVERTEELAEGRRVLYLAHPR